MLYIASPRLTDQGKLCHFGIDGAVEHLLWNIELCNSADSGKQKCVLLSFNLPD